MPYFLFFAMNIRNGDFTWIQTGFLLVILAYEVNPDLEFVTRTTGLSKYLVKQYVSIIINNEKIVSISAWHAILRKLQGGCIFISRNPGRRRKRLALGAICTGLSVPKNVQTPGIGREPLRSQPWKGAIPQDIFRVYRQPLTNSHWSYLESIRRAPCGHRKAVRQYVEAPIQAQRSLPVGRQADMPDCAASVEKVWSIGISLWTACLSAGWLKNRRWQPQALILLQIFVELQRYWVYPDIS